MSVIYTVKITKNFEIEDAIHFAALELLKVSKDQAIKVIRESLKCELIEAKKIVNIIDDKNPHLKIDRDNYQRYRAAFRQL